MGFLKYVGHYCLKCQSTRDEAIGGQPRCEACGEDLKHVDVSHTPVLFAGYFFLGVLIILVLGVAVTTLMMAWTALVAMALFAVIIGVIAIICILLNKTLMKTKIANSIPDRPFSY